MLFLLFLSWKSLDFFTHQRLFTDSAIFAAVAQHMAAGKLLYQEVWDHKPPMIYFINWFTMFWSDNIHPAIRNMERFFSLLATLSLFYIAYQVTSKLWIALMAPISFHWLFYLPQTIQGGNVTEEYGAVFLLLGMANVFLAKNSQYPFNNIFPFTAGFFFACAALTKEPFFVSSIIWFVYLIQFQKSGFEKFRMSLLALLGSFSVAIILILGFLYSGILNDWLDVIAYNFAYIQHSKQDGNAIANLIKHASIAYEYVLSQSYTILILAAFGIASCFHLKFAKKHHCISWWITAALVLDFLATTLSGFQIPHYYLQIIPSLCLVSTIGILFLYEQFQRLPFSVWILIGAILISLFTFDLSNSKKFAQRFFTPSGRVNLGPISYSLKSRKEPGDTFWAHLGENARYYTEAGLLSPSKYIYLYDHLFLDSWLTTAEEKKNQLINALQTNPPTYTVYSKHDAQIMHDLGLEPFHQWIVKNYKPIPNINDNGKSLWIHHDAHSKNP